MEETVIKDEIGNDKFNINKFETKDGCFLAVTSTDCHVTDVNVSFEDTVQTLYEKLADWEENSSCFPSGCTVSADESEEKIYKLSKVESGEQTYFRVYFKDNICTCLFSTSVKDLWKMITDISK
jgi:hypothetical protein